MPVTLALGAGKAVEVTGLSGGNIQAPVTTS